MTKPDGPPAPTAADGRKLTRRERRESLRRTVVTAVSITAALRAILFVLSYFQAWPLGGVATYALANVAGWGLLGVACELALLIVAIWAATTTLGGLRTPEGRSFARARILGWALIGNTVCYLASLVVGLWFADGKSLVAENAVYLLGALVLHLPVLWLSLRIDLRARRLMVGDRAVQAA